MTTVDTTTGTRIETMPFSKALNAGLRKAMEDDPRVLIMGEDIGALGGVFRVTEHLQRDIVASSVGVGEVEQLLCMVEQ